MFSCCDNKCEKDKNKIKITLFFSLFICIYLSFLLYHRGHAKPNETVLIHGASGGVSLQKNKEFRKIFHCFFVLNKRLALLLSNWLKHLVYGLLVQHQLNKVYKLYAIKVLILFSIINKKDI